MVDYLYDGTFEGLLTCVYHHYYTEKASGIFPAEAYQSTLLGGFREIETEEEKAVRVYEAIEKKISTYDLKRIYKVFCSSVERKECKILNYIRLGFRYGGRISQLHGDPIVFSVQEAEKQVGNEVHRLKGLIRFSVVGDGILYSKIEPDHDIVAFLAAHFCDRFRHDPIIIHDCRRQKALFGYEGNWHISFFTGAELPPPSQEEQEYRRLWKQYFRSITIRQRTNPRCQKNLMPVRYWKHLTEFL